MELDTRLQVYNYALEVYDRYEFRVCQYEKQKEEAKKKRVYQICEYKPTAKNCIRSVPLGLRFFKMLEWGLHYRQLSQPAVAEFRSAVRREVIIPIASELTRIQRYKSQGWKTMNSDFENRIEQFKPQVKEICCLLLDGDGAAFSGRGSSLPCGLQTASFFRFVLLNLDILRNSTPHLLPTVKHQIDFITRQFKVFANFAPPATTSFKTLGDELISRPLRWATHFSFLACLYWIDGADESLAASYLGTLLSDVMQKTRAYTPGVVASCLEPTLIHQPFGSYIDFLLQDLVMPDIEILREGLIFLISFMMNTPELSMETLFSMMDPTQQEAPGTEKVLGQIYVIINEFQSLICSIKQKQDEMKEGVSHTKLCYLLQEIARVKSEVTDLYAVTKHCSLYNAPTTNAIGFLDSFLRKLKKMLDGKVNFIASVKHDIQIIQEELTSLRPFLQTNLELQHEQEELKDHLWTRIVNVVYHAAYVIDLCPATGFFPIWYPMICLPSVREEIKLIKNEVKEVKDHRIYTNEMLPAAPMESRNRLLPQANTWETEGLFIGFSSDRASIIGQLLRDVPRNLTIICISGMPGQGKTTLAKRIYTDNSIRYHFQIAVWCYVSKGCKARELFLKILHELHHNGAEGNHTLENHVLGDLLRKSLKGRTYLIVMDDIWDVDLWREVKASFPNDNNGSRILFTSRNHNLASEADGNSISHPLQLFSLEESLELMNAVLNFGDVCEPNFFEIVEQIAICCKGLPLAIAITAAILGRAERKLDLWMQVAKNLTSQLASEGFVDTIELSYEYLPNHLKPCFLYFVAFPRGESVRAKKLKLLWIAEGLFQEDETKSSEELANEYLENLISRSLVVVTERSDLGEIKRCNVHDLLYDLCSEKAAKENFLYVGDKSTSLVDGWYFRRPKLRYGHHRLCIGASDPFVKPRRTCIREELPTSQVRSLLLAREYEDGEHQFSLDDHVFWFFYNFKVLTVLDLEGVHFQSRTFPEVIIFNIHLRYLALNGGFEQIPTSIADLWDLETLIIRCGGVTDPLPAAMWKMESLRHVNIETGFRLCFVDSCVAAYNIDTLCGPILGDNPQTLEAEVAFLRRLPRLSNLKCFCGKEDFIPIWFSVFGSLKKLKKLKVEGPMSYSRHTSVLEKLPPTCSSNSLLFPQNLKKLSLQRLGLGWDAMTSTVGKQLPKLEVLLLNLDSCKGRNWDFSNLRILVLRSVQL